jgi:signal transduction histidine kinase
VPLLAHGQLIGAFALVASSGSRRFDLADLRLAQELARRAALAIESARLYAAARRAIQARDDVLGVVAHDLRNPLNAIHLQAEMLREQEGRASGEAILRSVTRMNGLIQDILDVTRLEAGQLVVEQQRISTLRLLLDVVDAQRPLAEARGLALLLDVAPDVPEAWADHDRLLQIYENLIGNALKFTKHGRVTIGAAAHDGEVLLWVKDTGCGVAAEVLPHVFDRFWKSDTDSRRGAGLGLAIVKGLVEAHGGRVWAESTPGAGSCFYFTIPKAPSLHTAEAAHAP